MRASEMETDVVVVGCGGAGSIAAINAHDNGAEVIVLEKMPVAGGGTSIGPGAVLIPTGMELVEYIDAICLGTTERDIIETFVENAMTIEDYFRELGGESERWVSQDIGVMFPSLSRPSWPKAPNGKAFVRCHIKNEDKDLTEPNTNLSEAELVRKGTKSYGPAMWKLLSSNLESRGINIITGTRAKELIKNANGEVIGVLSEGEEGEIFVKAKRGVILTSGGFASNKDMQHAFLPVSPLYTLFPSPATGDGVIMAQEAGAALWHMKAMVAQLGFKPDEYENAFEIRVPSERFIYVDREGKRFTDETKLRVHDAWRAVSVFDSYNLRYPRIPAYLIFDEVTRKKAPLSRDERPQSKFVWSLDNSEEIARGWIKKGKTIKELAAQISMDGADLEDTVDKYNRYCKSGMDADFGRAGEFMGPIETGPYYAMELRPCILSTMGGPRHDREARVLDYDGKPIPRLYAAGELGSMWGGLYEAGGFLAESFVFGRIAGKNAAAQQLW